MRELTERERLWIDLLTVLGLALSLYFGAPKFVPPGNHPVAARQR